MALEVLVPMKPLASAKSRLSPGASGLRRKALALLMLHRVLKAVSEGLGPEVCQVVGGDDLVRQATQDAGCRWSQEEGFDLNSSLWLAIQEAFERGAKAILFLPADLLLATPADILAVIEASDGYARPVGVAAGRDGGTNALLLPVDRAFTPALGKQSFQRHRELAAAADAVLQSADVPNIAFDLDTPEELAWAMECVVGLKAELSEWEAWFLGQQERLDGKVIISPAPGVHGYG